MSEDSHREQGKYVLFSEARSRYESAGGMLQPSAVPDDGLCRVIVDYQRPAHAEGPAPWLRDRAERIAYLRGVKNIPTYPQIVGQAAARLCGPSGTVWGVGEMRREFAEVLAEAGLGVSLIRTDVVHSLVIFRLDATRMCGPLVWPPYGGDYGLRLFGFEGVGGGLGRRLERLGTTIRRNTLAADKEWVRIDIERAQRPPRSLATQVARTMLGTQEDVPPAIVADVLDQWRALLRSCWNRSTLRGLCQEALLCVLPDGPHHSEVSFNASRLSATEITAALSDILIERGVACSVIENPGEQYLMLSDFSRTTDRG